MLVVAVVVLAAVLLALILRVHRRRSHSTTAETVTDPVSDYLPFVMENPLYHGTPALQLGAPSAESSTDNAPVKGRRPRSASTLSASSRSESYDGALNEIGAEGRAPVSAVRASVADPANAAARGEGHATAALPDYRTLQPSYGVPHGAGALGQGEYADLTRATRAGVLGDRLADAYTAASEANPGSADGVEYASPAELTRARPATVASAKAPDAMGHAVYAVPAGNYAFFNIPVKPG